MKSIGMLFALPLTMATAFAQDYLMAKPEASGASGWVWESFADTVMGGNSELVPPAIIDADGAKALLLAGRVVTKGGGFIQVRLKHEKGRFDASAYSGVEIEVDARTEDSWFVFLRTGDTLFPWSYYGAPFKPSAGRSTIRIPWNAFTAASTLRKSVRTGSISSVALVAAFEDFNAYLRIYKAGFYR